MNAFEGFMKIVSEPSIREVWPEPDENLTITNLELTIQFEKRHSSDLRLRILRLGLKATSSRPTYIEESIRLMALAKSDCPCSTFLSSTAA